MKIISAIAVIAATTLAAPAFAQDAATERWTGGYGGLSYGQFTVSGGGPSDIFYDAHLGWNMAVGNSGLIAGLDLKLGQYEDSTASPNSESYASLVVGNAFSEQIFAYGFAGIGEDDGDRAYQAGVGLDYGITGNISIGAQVFKGWFADNSTEWTSVAAIVKYSF